MLGNWRPRERMIGVLVVILAAGALVMDAMSPREAALGGLYVPIVVLAMFTRRTRFVLFVTALVTVLTVVGYIVSLNRGLGSPAWVTLVRGVGIISIALSGFLATLWIQAMRQVEAGAARERLLLEELEHRMRNNFAALTAAVDFISRPPEVTKEDLVREVKCQLRALADVHRLLSRSGWNGVWLGELMRTVAGPDSDSIDADGPPVWLSPRQVGPLGMIFTELGLNARKYGALKSPGGRVEVRWSLTPGAVGGDGRLDVSWREVGGPPITEEPRYGRGTQIIGGLIEHELRGKLDLSYPPTGANHRFSVSLPAAPAPAAAQPVTAARRPAPVASSPL